ncbi:MAG: molecular chaperone HtpG [Cytophagia bacterium]|nr:MAG: molecular chaperone HtpG [Cytophagia bacterium]TAH28272.1 MAG: molecular chaperone HtpG [Cytophagales bacterium]
MVQEQGTISVNTENIFPIIKKFLYSDHEIFLRELVSNAMDASQKLKKLSVMGEYNGEIGELKVKISLDKEAKTITISDNGIGMTAEEVKKYINQVAFSGATEFVEKYKDKQDTKEIIGHFGLGFYSAFMISQKVEIVTKSFREDTEAVRWECDGSTSFSIEKAEKTERGSDIILHVADDSIEFLEEHRLRDILNKYCRFLPIEIQFGEDIINNTHPIWTKSPQELTEEDYKKFYSDLYPMSEEPLFWIHLNVDYPFNLTGILYFPKIREGLDLGKDKIQLYSRQVFITDEIKNIVPEFLTLLRGVIDSPDIPLNVSRSFLQADSNVKKINGYITKKVAEKLQELFNDNRPDFEAKWESIGVFVKYGYVTDEKFQEKAQKFAMVQNTENQFFTIEEYREKVQATQTDKSGKVVFIYTNDTAKQDSYIQSAKKKGYDVLKLDDRFIDPHFISGFEQKTDNIQLKRVDSDTSEKLIDTGINAESVLSEEQTTKLKELFEKVLDNKTLSVLIESLPQDEMPVIITQPEFIRRMQEMSRGGGMMGMGNFMMLNVSVNANHSIIHKILESDETTQIDLIKQVYDLALLSQNMLNGEALTRFVQRSVNLVK